MAMIGLSDMKEESVSMSVLR